MRRPQLIALGLTLALAAGPDVFADVQLSIENGRVSIVAREATVRQILAEWARVGQTRIVNGDRVPGGPVTIELTNVSEREALDVLLRAASGYVAAPRPAPVAGASLYDRILVLPTSVAPAAPPSRPAAPVYRQPGQPPFRPRPADDNDEGGRPAPNVGAPARGPVFRPFPQPQVVNPQQPAGVVPAEGPLELPRLAPAPGGPTIVPAAPYGSVPVPGMVVPAPPAQPGQGPRRPGGGPGGPDQR